MLLAVGGTNSNSIILNDERDGNQYETLQVGNLTIMAENLNYDIDGATCFRESEDFCSKYGRLYNYKTAMKGSEEEYAQGICPNGWHIPSAAFAIPKLFRLGLKGSMNGSYRDIGTSECLFVRFCWCPLLLSARDEGAGVATLTVLAAGSQ